MNNKKKYTQSKDFHHYFLFSSIPIVKTGLWTTIVLFISYSIIHTLLFPDSTTKKYLDNFWILLPSILLVLLAFQIRKLHKYLHTILISINLLSILGLFFVGVRSDIHDPGYIYFIPWVMLVMMGIFIFYRIRFYALVTICILMIISVIISMIMNGTLTEEPEVFLINVFFMVAMTTLGYFVLLYRMQITQRHFLSELDLINSNESLSKEIIKKEAANKIAIDAEKNYRTLVDSMPDWIIVINNEFKIDIINSAVKSVREVLGTPTEVIGKNIFEVYPFLGQNVRAGFEQVLMEKKEVIQEDLIKVDGNSIVTEARMIPIFRENEVVQIMIIIRDISQKVEIEQLKRKNAEQKEILLREIHHRVKNNLAIVISLLDMQVRENENPEFHRLSKDIELRIRSMALIHEQLYKSDELDRIPFGNYIQSLAAIISATYTEQKIKLNTKFDPAIVKIEMAMPLGLIINEILTNSFKYAFTDRHEGIISIDMKLNNAKKGLYELTIKDNGVGLPEKFLTESDNSLGMFIIHLLCKQIDAELTISNNPGASFKILFKAIINGEIK